MNQVANLQHLTLTQVIQRIQSLIDANDGDIGRLYHVLEFLKQNKPLYHSDQRYLENKINTVFIIIDDEKPKENEALSKIQALINSGNGDPGRLQHICDMLSQNKSLYHSDQVYLDDKLGSNGITPNNTIHFDVKTEDKINQLDELEKEIKILKCKIWPFQTAKIC